MKLWTLMLILLPICASAQSSPLDLFNQYLPHTKYKEEVRKGIESCKTSPADCEISHNLFFSGRFQHKERRKAKILIRQDEFQKNNPKLKGEKLSTELARIESETILDYLKHFDKLETDPYFKEAYEIRQKDHRKLYGPYTTKAYYDVVPDEFQQVLDQNELERKKIAKEINDLGLKEKITNWKDHDFIQKEFQDLLPQPTCKDEAIIQLLKLFKDDNLNILGKQFELTAIKTALLLKKDAGYSSTELKSLEDFVNTKQKDLAVNDKMSELKKIYAHEGKQEDIKRLEGMSSRIKKGEYNYYNSETRMVNSDVSAFYLLMDKHEEEGTPDFGVEDAAVAWAFGSLANQIKDKSSPQYSKMSLSNQVNKLMDSRVAGGTNTSVEKLEEMQLSSESEINDAIKESLKSKLSPECLAELSLDKEEGCDVSLVGIKSEAFSQMMKEITGHYDKAQGSRIVAGYYGEVKDFIGKVTINSRPKKTAAVQSKAPEKLLVLPDARSMAPKDNTQVVLPRLPNLKPTVLIKKPVKKVSSPQIGDHCMVGTKFGKWSIKMGSPKPYCHTP